MKKILLPVILVMGVGLSAQLVGTKTIGTDYPSLADAITDLNTNGVGSGGVIINVPAGYTETAPSGGFNLGTATLNATLSANNPLVIQKSGSGANPLLTANTGLGAGDAIFALKGVDYTTIDGINLQENSTNVTAGTDAAYTEYGYGFFNLVVGDGCQYNTIKNSTITFLDKPTANIAAGIYANPATYSNGALATVAPTNIEGIHSYNKIYSNTIIKPFAQAITFLGGGNTAAIFGLGNDIGGSSVATGNTITGLLGATWTSTAGQSDGYSNSYGILFQYQNNGNVSFNTIKADEQKTNSVVGDSFLFSTLGIFLNGAGSTLTANNNNISLVGSSISNGLVSGVYCGTTTNLTANKNNISIDIPFNFNAATSTLYGIYAGNTTAPLTATGNTLNIGSSFSGAVGIYSNSANTVNVTDNVIRGAKATSSAYGVFLAASGLTTNLFRNKIYNFSASSTTGATYGVVVNANTANANVNIVNNLIGDLRTPAVSSTGVSLAGIYFAASTNNANYNVYYNTINLNGTSTGTNFNSSGIYHVYANSTSISVLDLRNNIISNLSTPKGTGYATAYRRSSATNLSNYATTSNNNNFSVGSLANSKVFYNGTTAYDFAGFQTLVSSRESNSLNYNLAFSSTSGSDANFLNLDVNDSNTKLLDNKGQALASYTTDYLLANRNATTPDIGAYEFTAITMAVADIKKANISVSPNPFTDVLRISNVDGVRSISIYDMIGREVRSLLPSTEINLTNLGSGLYIINLKMEDGSVKSIKAIKK